MLFILSSGFGLILAFMMSTSLRAAAGLSYFKKMAQLGCWLFPKLALLILVGLSLFLFTCAYDCLVHGPVGFALNSSPGEVKSLTNVVLITLDAQRADSLTEELMPNILAFSQKGQRYSRAYAPSPWTLPTFASVFSGKDPGEIGSSVYNFSMDEAVRHYELDEQFYTLAEQFQDAGYLTQAIITNKNLSSRRGFAQGFDGFVNFEDILPYHWHFHTKKMVLVRVAQRLPFLGKWVQKTYDFLVGKSAEDAFRARAQVVSEGALRWLETKRQTPFFLWLHYIDPHAPYDPVREFSPELKQFSEVQEQVLRAPNLSLEEIRWREIDKEAVKLLYDGETRYGDEQIGTVLDWLTKKGYLKSTLVVITSDHGEEFLDHGNLGHGKSLYEELVKVPLVVRADGMESFETGEIKKLVSLIDLGPTLFKLVGVNSHLGPGWFDHDYPETVFFEATSTGPEIKGVIRERWKAIWNPFIDQVELFDLVGDSEETINMAGDNSTVALALGKFIKKRAEKNQTLFKKRQQRPDEVKDFGRVVGY
jgi:arylsulfatase A-like enzyme